MISRRARVAPAAFASAYESCHKLASSRTPRAHSGGAQRTAAKYTQRSSQYDRGARGQAHRVVAINAARSETVWVVRADERAGWERRLTAGRATCPMRASSTRQPRVGRRSILHPVHLRGTRAAVAEYKTIRCPGFQGALAPTPAPVVARGQRQQARGQLRPAGEAPRYAPSVCLESGDCRHYWPPRRGSVCPK